jgi:hypothetical protein
MKNEPILYLTREELTLPALTEGGNGYEIFRVRTVGGFYGEEGP